MVRRYARLEDEQGPAYAELDGDSWWVLDRAPYLSGVSRTGAVAASDSQWLAPVSPSKIVCIGRNYRAHAEELGNTVPEEPLLFLKPPSSLLAPRGHVELPPQSQRVEHEVELGIIMGARARDVSEHEASDLVFGYTVVGDITARDLQRSDKTWARGKGFDTFCPAGPHLVSGVDVACAGVRCSVNGELRQNGNTDLMIFSPAELIAYISRVMTLEPGDLIATGTPAGVGPLVDGDEVVMAIDTIGELPFSVRRR